MDHCAVFVRRSDGSWQPVETTSMGSYLLFTAEGENLQLAVLTTAAVWWLWAIFLALIAAVVFFIVRFARRRRGKKAAKPSKKENGPASAGCARRAVVCFLTADSSAMPALR